MPTSVPILTSNFLRCGTHSHSLRPVSSCWGLKSSWFGQIAQRNPNLYLFSQPHQKLTLPLYISKHGSWLHRGSKNSSPWYAQVGRGSFFYLGYSFGKNFPGAELAPLPTTHTHPPYKRSTSSESKTQRFSLYLPFMVSEPFSITDM